MSARPTTELPGATERAQRGPVHHKGPGPAPTGWLDPRGRSLGGRTFALHRLTGLALVVYLYVHLGVLSMLLIGESAWSDFLSVVSAKSFLAFDVVLLAGLVFHALNGIRVAVVGSGFAVHRQRALLWAAIAVGTPMVLYGALHVLGGV
jgi:succinate dehydrogenase / fumarate reductase, cytochrome b subunit